MRKIILGALFYWVILQFGCDQKTLEIAPISETAKLPVFEKITSQQSGITFANIVKEDISTKENVFDFDYFYNGAGVGIADLDNDGLQDIVFTGNQEANRIYKNKGNLAFEDVTRKSRINQGKGWANGVTFVDINQDGWLDIYICQGGLRSEEQRKNRLFINQKDMTFSEEAAKYGLADASISTQAVFFDYDKDGDLDLLVLNETPFFGYGPEQLKQILAEKSDYRVQSSSHFYENKDGKYRNITFKAGLLRPSFGLGVVVDDFNQDGWLDVYMTNDYYLPDVLYVNDQNGGFTDETKKMTEQVSFFGMGVDVGDINNDEYSDIFVLDMAMADHYKAKTRMASMNTKQFDLLVNEYQYQEQYMYNSLQLNTGNHSYRNVSQLTGLSKTDWSWAVLMTDFNNDEHKDIFVSNGYKKFAIDNDVRVGVNLARNVFKGNVPLDVKKRLYDQMPSEKINNALFENKGRLQFENVANKWGLDESSFSNGAAYGDLDGDGDLELVVNNIDDQAFLYKNLSVEQRRGNFLNVICPSLNGESFAKVTIKYDQKSQTFRAGRVRGYLSAVQNIAHFGIGKYQKIDTVIIDWPSGNTKMYFDVKANELLIAKEEEMKTETSAGSHHKSQLFDSIDLGEIGLAYLHEENDYDDFAFESLLPFKQSTLGPFISTGDVDGDGTTDVLIGGAAGQSTALFLRKEQGYVIQNIPDFERDKAYEDLESVFFDYDMDGDLDLMIVSGGNAQETGSDLYQDRLYINDGQGGFKRKFDPALNHRFSGKSIVAIDYDADGRQDIIIGNRMIPQHYPKNAPSFVLKNTESGFEEVTAKVMPFLENFGMINQLLKTDFNKDGKEDIIAVGEWTGIGMFQNQGQEFVDVSEQYGVNDKKGWWFHVAETDVNGDGLADYVVGNVGLNSKYKASSVKPLKVFANDFDENGTWDLVLSQKYNGNYVPFRGRQCSSEQMPFIAKKFETYDAFAKASLFDVYGEGLENAYQREANTFKSTLLINQGDNGFQLVDLPTEAQLSPILSSISKDLNGDGFEDLIIGGNIYNTEVETPQLDAGIGLVLLSNKKDGYQVMQSNQSGLFLGGNLKSIKLLEGETESVLLGGVNNGALIGYKIDK